MTIAERGSTIDPEETMTKRRIIIVALAAGPLLAVTSAIVAGFPTSPVSPAGEAVTAGTPCLDRHGARVSRVSNPSSTRRSFIGVRCAR